MIKYLNINDQDYPIRVSYYALKKLKLELGRTLSADDDGSDYDAYEALLFYSLEKGHKIEGIPMPFKRKEMEDLMDDCYFRFLQLVPQFFEMLAEEQKPNGGPIGKK